MFLCSEQEERKFTIVFKMKYEKIEKTYKFISEILKWKIIKINKIKKENNVKNKNSFEIYILFYLSVIMYSVQHWYKFSGE